MNNENIDYKLVSEVVSTRVKLVSLMTLLSSYEIWQLMIDLIPVYKNTDNWKSFGFDRDNCI